MFLLAVVLLILAADLVASLLEGRGEEAKAGTA